MINNNNNNNSTVRNEREELGVWSSTTADGHKNRFSMVCSILFFFFLPYSTILNYFTSAGDVGCAPLYY